MVRKIKAKAILRLNDQGLSGRAIARSLGIARQSGSARKVAHFGRWPVVGVTSCR